MKFKAGMRVGPWTLVSELGRGGNGVVWLAERADTTAALKVLANPGGDRWARFRDEIEVMRRLGDHPGVLPLIDAHLPEAGDRELAWLATPRASRVATALADATVAEVVGAVMQYAEVLADLAEQGIHHRDVKPDNLFAYEGNWVLGDFGLAAYPGKEPVTSNARRLGPLYFIAPEMLREPDSANAELADVFSLAKTLWVLATGQRYPPEGQIRVDVPAYELSQWVSGDGLLALGLVLEQATSVQPEDRLAMADLAKALERWAADGAAQDDAAEKVVRERYVQALGARLAGTLDPDAIAEVERQLSDVLREARTTSVEKQREAMREARAQGEAERLSYLKTGGVKAALNLSDSVWIGTLGDAKDFAYAVLQQPEDERYAQLIKARQILWGRPLWWMHSAALGGMLQLLGEPGCDPLATELATQEIRFHLLDFADHPTLALAWRYQRALVPLTARIVALGPLDEMAAALRARLSVADRLRYSATPDRVFVITVEESVRAQLRQAVWTPAALTALAEESEKTLERIPTPATEWPGPIGDPWLASWSRESPLVMCGLSILSSHPQGDDLLTDQDVRDVIADAAASDSPVMKRAVSPLALRLGL
jgi:hypothetical protein